MGPDQLSNPKKLPLFVVGGVLIVAAAITLLVTRPWASPEAMKLPPGADDATEGRAVARPGDPPPPSPPSPLEGRPEHDMVFIPDDGPFWRGHPDGPPHPFGNPDTHPMRRIRLSGYWIDRTEVSMGNYGRCMAAEVCAPPSCSGFPMSPEAEQPVACVSWHDAQVYCEWIGGRLPTEAEWEKAARGLDGRKYPWGIDRPTCDVALFNECGAEEPAKVGSFPRGASPYGVLDLAGNVAEWVADFYDPDYYRDPASSEVDPSGPASGTTRSVRGGSYLTGARHLMTGYRNHAAPETQRPDLGFRCAVPAK